MKSTFLGKESTSPVKVVNCTQARQSTESVRVGKCLRTRPKRSQHYRFFCNLVEEASLYLYRFLYKEVYETLSKMALTDCAKY